MRSIGWMAHGFTPKVRLVPDEEVERLLRAYRMKRRGILSEVIRAGLLKPDLPHWPVWDPA